MNEAAKVDAERMAVLISNIKSGLIVFEAVFKGLESNYQPFADAEFREKFYSEVKE